VHQQQQLEDPKGVTVNSHANKTQEWVRPGGGCGVLRGACAQPAAPCMCSRYSRSSGRFNGDYDSMNASSVLDTC
jgi:hypothetical protein